MTGEDVGDTFSGCLARQMAGEDVGDPFPGKSTYDASGLEWMRRFSYPSLRYALRNGGVQWAGISNRYECSPRFLINDVSAILGGPSIVVRGRLGPADSNDIQKYTTSMRVRCRSHFPSCMASMDVASAVAQIRGTSWI
ncbi:hypothetical protein Y032_1032g3447 [Ancylostoma ceylanicum]|uniref:Uncharacterized protein n=1 Tax=Ancylostoma ceylanicum TaxID=53326 RepID=A0A016W6W0_9BILA|nr:hypothetical protein Y032_1032g3447 [Ancylostoma ceylanicum]